MLARIAKASNIFLETLKIPPLTTAAIILKDLAGIRVNAAHPTNPQK